MNHPKQRLPSRTKCSRLVTALSLIGTTALAAGLTTATASHAGAESTYAEQEGHHGANTFTNYHNASGMGPRIDPAAWVQISCKVYDPYIQSVNPDGYWYRIASSPWNDGYYSPANTFMNGDPWDGPYTHNTDFNVPDCGSNPPPPPPSPSVSLAQGPTAPSGYRYAITLDHFAANSGVSVSCRDSADPGGFYSFSLSTNGSGYAFTQSFCYSADGPDHWVIANGSVESNHVSWTIAAPPRGGPPAAPPAQPPAPQAPAPGSGSSETCEAVDGVPAPTSNLSEWLIGHFEGGYSSAVAIPWAYFSGNPQFVKEAKSIPEGGQVIGWRAVFPSDMYFALGHFTIKHTSAHCYSIYDLYDFSKVELPFWLQQKLKSAIPFEIHASGRLD